MCGALPHRVLIPTGCCPVRYLILYRRARMEFSPSPDRPVLVIGAAGVDIIGRLRGELQLGTSNPAQIRTSLGGVSRNVAENLARLGHPVRLVTAVGRDRSGDQLLQYTAAAGVDVSAVLRLEDCPTGAYLAAIGARGDVQVALDDMRAVAALSPAMLDQREQLFAEASLLFVDANLSRQTLSHAFALARRFGLPVCADPASALLAPRLRRYLRRLNLVTPNLTESAILCGREPPASSAWIGVEAAKCLVGQGVGLAIITLAEAGVCYATSDTSGQVPAIRTEVTDPTGGGDALTAAVLFALLNDIPLDDAIRLGVSAAAITLRYPGAVDPDLSLEKLYDELVI